MKGEIKEWKRKVRGIRGKKKNASVSVRKNIRGRKWDYMGCKGSEGKLRRQNRSEG